MKTFTHGRPTIECDSCDETIEGTAGEMWDDFWSGAKRLGWKAKKIGAEWVHGCPKHEV